MHEKKRTKKVIIEGKKEGKKITTARRVVSPRRRIEDIPMPAADEEWDEYFHDHQYGFGADLKRHALDYATDTKPMGPWFERLP